METIDGSAADSTINITGNGKNNYLVAGDNGSTLTGGAGNDLLIGGNGNDSLWGGARNDSFYGGEGNDTFIYKPGEGTDKIFDYDSNDILTILKADGSEGGTFKSSKFSGGDLTLTIKGGGKVIFDSAGNVDKFNINGTSYKISGSKLVK